MKKSPLTDASPIDLLKSIELCSESDCSRALALWHTLTTKNTKEAQNENERAVQISPKKTPCVSWNIGARDVFALVPILV